MLSRNGSGRALVVALTTITVACGTRPGPVRTTTPPGDIPVSTRASDRLMILPEIQDVSELREVVELQVARNGEALIERLADPDSLVRARAAFALASVQDTAAVPALLNALDDRSSRVRADAAFALGQVADSTVATRLLMRLQQERVATVLDLLLEALGKTGGSESLASLSALDFEEDRLPAFAMAVARYGMRGVTSSEATDRMAALLRSSRPEVRRNAAYFFARASEVDEWAPAAESLRQAMDGYAVDDRAAMHILTALGRLGNSADAPLLARWLTDGEPWMTRTNAARSLGALAEDGFDTSEADGDSARAALFAALDDPVRHVGVAAASALSTYAGFIEAEAGAGMPGEPGMQMVQRSNVWIDANPREWWISSQLLPILVRGDREEEVLEWLRAPPAGGVFARASGLAALAASESEESFDYLTSAAADEDPRIAAAALGAIATRWRQHRTESGAPQRFYPVFAEAVRSRDVGAIYAVAPLMADTLLEPMDATALLRDTYADLQTPEDLEAMTAILAALGRAADAESESLLREELEHANSAIRRAAAASFESLTGEAAPQITPPASPEEEVSPPELDWEQLARWGRSPRLVLETERGSIVIAFAAEQAPLTTQTLLRFAEEGRYDGVPFHRVVPNFVIQGGDYARSDGFGGPDFSILSEFTRLPYQRGAAGMASAGKDTEGSQYFVTHSMQPHLDGLYTAFGYVVQGMLVVDRIQPGDRVLSATVSGTPDPAPRQPGPRGRNYQ